MNGFADGPVTVRIPAQTVRELLGDIAEAPRRPEFSTDWHDNEPTLVDVESVGSEDPTPGPIPTTPIDDEETGKQCRRCWRRVEECVCPSETF